MEEQLVLEKRLDGLKIQHRELDGMIKKMDEDRLALNEFQMAKLKKEKLKIKDEIIRIEREIYDDLIA
jgi:hypothetical protein